MSEITKKIIYLLIAVIILMTLGVLIFSAKKPKLQEKQDTEAITGVQNVPTREEVLKSISATSDTSETDDSETREVSEDVKDSLSAQVDGEKQVQSVVDKKTVNSLSASNK